MNPDIDDVFSYLNLIRTQLGGIAHVKDLSDYDKKIIDTLRKNLRDAFEGIGTMHAWEDA